MLGLAVYREFGPAGDPAVVFFLGQGLLEISGHAPGPSGASVKIWLQVRDVRAEHDRLAAAGVRIVREPMQEPWGLAEMRSKIPMAFRSCWSRFPPATRCAATRDDLDVKALTCADAAARIGRHEVDGGALP